MKRAVGIGIVVVSHPKCPQDAFLQRLLSKGLVFFLLGVTKSRDVTDLSLTSKEVVDKACRICGCGMRRLKEPTRLAVAMFESCRSSQD